MRLYSSFYNRVYFNRRSVLYKKMFDITYCCVTEIVTTHCCCDGCVTSHIVAVAVRVTQYALLSTAARYCYCRGRAGHYCLMLPPLLFLRQKKTCSLNYLILIPLISCVEQRWQVRGRAQ